VSNDVRIRGKRDVKVADWSEHGSRRSRSGRVVA
jgi:hypothetical protein